MLHHLSKFIYFKILRWKLIGGIPEIKKCIIIVVPHTSWVDFPLGVLVRKVLNIRINYIGKKSLFTGPFGWFFSWMGGAPVDRGSKHDTVSQVVRIFQEKEQFRLALAPEGTRKEVTKWRTGFYYMALGAGVPIIQVAFDYGRKQVKISDPKVPTGNIEADLKEYREFYKGVEGKIPGERY